MTAPLTTSQKVEKRVRIAFEQFVRKGGKPFGNLNDYRHPWLLHCSRSMILPALHEQFKEGKRKALFDAIGVCALRMFRSARNRIRFFWPAFHSRQII